MSKYHGEQFWSEMKHQTLHDWRELNEDDFDTLRSIRHAREVRQREQRARTRLQYSEMLQTGSEH